MKTQIINRKIILVPFIIAGMLSFNSCIIYKNGPAAVPVSQIIQMSKEGVHAKDIIKDMRQTRSVYILKASEYADLRNAGVQDSVLNYMEKTKTDAIRQNERMDNYGYWDPYWPGYWYGGWPYGYFGYGFGPTIIFRGDLRPEHHFSHNGFHGRR